MTIAAPTKAHKGKTQIWYTADGRDLQVRQMDSEHIRNCLTMIEERWLAGRPWRTRYYATLRRELRRRAEH